MNIFQKFAISTVSITLFFLPQMSEAATVQWNNNNLPKLYYLWNWNNPSTSSLVGAGWAPGLAANANASVTYNAYLTNADTGVSIASGASISQGTRIRCESTYTDSDIFWNGTGLSSDSPNGTWSNNAGEPSNYCAGGNRTAAGINSGGSCANPYYAYGGGPASFPHVVDTFTALTVHRPSHTCSFSGSASVSQINSDTWQVNSGGTVNVNAVFPATYGKFYYGYQENEAGSYVCSYINGCVHNNVAMNTQSNITSGGGCSTIVDANGTTVYECVGGYNPSAAGAYTLNIPEQSIAFNLTATGTNTPPPAPTITGPATGSINTPYTFTIKAQDPDNNQIKYGIDDAPIGATSPEQYRPTSDWVASNTEQTMDYTFSTPGTYTFRAQTLDNQGGVSGWTEHTIIINPAPLAPTLSFTINGTTTGPIDVARDTPLNLTWNATNVTGCSAYGANFGNGLDPVPLNGTASITATQSDLYLVNCTTATGNITSSIQVNLANTLKVCRNSCASGTQRGTGAQGFTLAQGGTETLVACFNSYNGCTDPSGDITSSALWPETNTPNNAVALTPGSQIIVNTVNQGQERFSSTYSGQSQLVDVTVTCIPSVSCTNAPGRDGYCQNESFSVDNGCGVPVDCNGTKTCDFNWKEVAP
jgi:hypothetical protein